MRKSKRVRQRRPKPILPVRAEDIVPGQAIEPSMPEEDEFTETIVVPTADLSEPSTSEVDEVMIIPMATPYIPWYVAGRSKPGEVVRVKDEEGRVQVVIVPEGGLQ